MTATIDTNSVEHDSILVQAITAAVIQRGAEMVKAIAPMLAVEIARGLAAGERDRLYVPLEIAPRSPVAQAMPEIRRMVSENMGAAEIMRELRLSRSSVYAALARIREVELAKSERDPLYVPLEIAPQSPVAKAMPKIRRMVAKNMTPAEIRRETRLSRTSVYEALAKIQAGE